MRPIPRHTSDTYDNEDNPADNINRQDSTSFGTSGEYIYGYSGELNLQLFSRSVLGPGVQLIPTGFFVGSGVSANSLYNEIYVQFGANPFYSVESGGGGLGYFIRIKGFELAAMSRAGTLNSIPGMRPRFDDLASGYLMNQGTVRLRIRLYGFPLTTEFSITNTTGLFVGSRPADVIDKIKLWKGDDISADDLEAEIKETYQFKEPLKERFYSLKVQLGSFVFETYNDSKGGKDIGPSFGLRTSLVLSPDYKRLTTGVSGATRPIKTVWNWFSPSPEAENSPTTGNEGVLDE